MVKGKADCGIQRVGGADPKFPQNSFYLGPKLFNGIQVRTVRRQIQDLCSSAVEQLTYRLDMMRPEIIHDHDIVWAESGD